MQILTFFMYFSDYSIDFEERIKEAVRQAVMYFEDARTVEEPLRKNLCGPVVNISLLLDCLIINELVFINVL